MINTIAYKLALTYVNTIRIWHRMEPLKDLPPGYRGDDEHCPMSNAWPPGVYLPSNKWAARLAASPALPFVILFDFKKYPHLDKEVIDYRSHITKEQPYWRSLDKEHDYSLVK